MTLATIDAAAIAALVASPSTIARCSKPKAGTAKPSVEAEAARPRDAQQRVAQRGEVRAVQAAAVDAAHAARDDGDAVAAVRRTTG